MSDRDNWKINVPRQIIFEVFDPNTGLPVTGLLQGAFTTAIFLNCAVPGSVPTITITEIGAGRYFATFTPNAIGYWYFAIRHATYNVQGWVDESQVFPIAADDPVTVASASITAIVTAILTTPINSYEAAVTGVRCLVSVVQRIRNKVSRTAPTVVTVFRADGVTPAWTTTVVTDPSQLPVISEAPN